MTKHDPLKTLVSWVGATDLKDLDADRPDGPIASILRDSVFDVLHYFYTSDHDEKVKKLIEKLCREHKKLQAKGHSAESLRPDDYSAIDKFMKGEWPEIGEDKPELTINLTSGTSAMCAIMFYIGRHVGAKLLTTRSPEYAKDGMRVMTVDWSFGPAMRQASGSEHEEIYGLSKHELNDLQFKIAPVKDAVGILIQGETGSGKSYLAGYIHKWSERSGKFKELNCAAIATDSNTFKSELFGHVKGAFTGAEEAKEGAFKEADKGTLFLDEVAELTPEQQARLLTVVQEKTFRPLGGTEDMKSDVLLIVATNQDLVVVTPRAREI